MPSPVTPRRNSLQGSPKSTPNKTKKIDIGKPLGPHDTNSVREKIRLWQQQGGGVVKANDIVVEEESTEDDSNGDEDELSNKKLGGHKRNSRDNHNGTKTPERTTPRSDNKTRPRAISAPRKRVISDQHWRKERSPNTAPPPKTATPKRITVYKINDPSEYSSDGKPDSRGSSCSLDGGVRVYATPPSSNKNKTSSRNATQTSKYNKKLDEVNQEENKMSSESCSSSLSSRRTSPKSYADDHTEVPAEPKRRTPPPRDEDDWAKSEADFSELSRLRARRGPVKTRAARNPPKGGLLSHVLDESKKMFAKPTPPPPAPNRGEKIEAWLSATPDPFVEDDEPPVEVPAPLKLRSKTTKNSGTSRTDEEYSEVSREERRSNHLQEDDSIEPTSERSQSADIVSPASERDLPSTEARKERESSPASLKRSGAHRRNKSVGANSPTKRVTANDSTARLDSLDLAPSSDGSEVSPSEASFQLKFKRPFPSTGAHRLSTIASVETLSTVPGKEATGGVSQDGSVLNSGEEDDVLTSLRIPGPGLKRRLKKHSDLMSVLSDPNSGRRSIRSSRSIRTHRSRLAKATVDDILQELALDEMKYMRELRTLVGGVIPVLLTCVLSRSESAVAAGLFSPGADPKDAANFTRPIVDMGVALNRLKTLHKRIPVESVDALLTWAHGAQRLYRDYLKSWRLGFQDVIVNMAPIEDDEKEGENESVAIDTKSLDQGLERDENGDIIDGDGEKVDVAYLLKRPLVRLKYLSKTLKGINILDHSSRTEELVDIFQKLVEEARQRSYEERARVEDESAARVDATRARDPETLGVLSDVIVNPKRRVLARDFFDFSLYHSTGQMLDCQVELLLRDNPRDEGKGGDLLVCEVDDSGRWLLFPPIELNFVSARKGDKKGEIVVMLRGKSAEGGYWQELLLLKIDEADIGLEWVQMLGSDPYPPAVLRTQSFIKRSKRSQAESAGKKDTQQSLASPKRLPAGPDQVDIPMGERASVLSRGGKSSMLSEEQSSGPSTVSLSSSETSRTSIVSAITKTSEYGHAHSDAPSKESLTKTVTPGLETEASSSENKADELASALRRAKELADERTREQSSTPESAKTSPTRRRSSSGIIITATGISRPKQSKTRSEKPSPAKSTQSRVSSVPSLDLPTIKKVRHTSGNSETHIKDADDSEDEEASSPPPPPPHRSGSSSGQLKLLKILNLPPPPPLAPQQKRRTSSPLKHEYEPSSASDSTTDSDTSTVRHHDLGSSSSETSDDDWEDDNFSVSHALSRQKQYPKRSPPSSAPTLDVETLSPSNSASQGPYRTVPPQPSKASKAVASILFWSDKGSWESLFPDECSIVVTPGLIEAYQMSSSHSDPQAKGSSRRSYDGVSGSRPLVALELTPLVPIRRGTAIDITIRSPPTERSKIRTSNNILFRSRTIEECENLYSLINQARINNPTYIALQNARGPFVNQPMTAGADPMNSGGGSSWFGFPRRKNSYRAADKRAPSVGMVSESSVGTMSSAFSALKRFGGGSKMFNMGRGSRDGSLYSSSLDSGAKSSGGSGLAAIAEAIKGADGIGLSNAKIRLYVRESMQKWRDMGAARLTIMPASPNPSRPDTAMSNADETNIDKSSPETKDCTDEIPASPATPGSPRRPVSQEKRILIHGKTQGEVLLDVCLGESSFERVARTGIAVSVWEESEEGTIRQKGGVGRGAFRVYMIQLKSEAEAAYTFGLVGKLRY